MCFIDGWQALKMKQLSFFLVRFHLARLLFLHVLTHLNSVPFSTDSCSSSAEILSQPTNEKYRSLRKDNAVVKVPTRVRSRFCSVHFCE